MCVIVGDLFGELNALAVCVCVCVCVQLLGNTLTIKQVYTLCGCCVTVCIANAVAV